MTEQQVIYRYNPKTDQWTTVASMSVPRDAVGICVLGGKLYACGGYDGKNLQGCSKCDCALVGYVGKNLQDSGKCEATQHSHTNFFI